MPSCVRLQSGRRLCRHPSRYAPSESVGGSHEHVGWGPGSGTMERYEFHCPCGGGSIIEEHDNVPGFREHNVWIECERCRTEWRFADPQIAQGWGLVPSTPGLLN